MSRAQMGSGLQKRKKGRGLTRRPFLLTLGKLSCRGA